MAIDPASSGATRALVRPSDLSTTWLIARRGALESLRDPMTLWMSALFSIAVPLIVVMLVLRPAASESGASAFGDVIASFLLIVGLMPSSGSIGIASGMFAGEKEQGSLLPLLASPASNRAIFAGKVLGAVLPALLYSTIAEVSYLVAIVLVLGPAPIRLMPLALSVALVALVPANATLGAAVASLISSRVRTYQSAQMLSGLVLVPVMGALFTLAIQMHRWGAGYLFIAVAAVVALDVAVIAVSAATWRREEVMGRR